MFVGRINKEYPDVSRFTVDLSDWLDEGETATNILTHTITLGTTGWSNTPFPVPGAAPPYDPTPLLYTEVKLVDGGTAVEVYVSFGTPGNVYTCQFEIIGTTLREVTFEVGVQISGQPPAAVPIVTQPVPLDALSIYGGQMLGPLYLYRDPTYPTEASTKQYVDFAISLMQVSTKVDRSGDTMSGFLSLSNDPVQPLQAATKHYVDTRTGTALTDAPSDGFFYGRHNLAWSRVIEEAPVNTSGYLRSNAGWIRGVPEVGATTIDVRVTDNNGTNLPVLAGMQTPFSAATDVFSLAARRTSTGAIGDGGVIQLFGPTAANPNVVNIYAGPRAVGTTKVWGFDQTGTLTAPGLIVATGQIRSNTGRLMSFTNDGTIPTVIAWDLAHSVASGFWVGPTGTIRLGQADGNGAPVTTWTSVSSTGIDTGTLSTSANVSVGTSLGVGGDLNVAGSVGISGLLTVSNLSVPGDISSNTLHTNQINVTGAVAVGTGLSANAITANAIASNGSITAVNNVVAGGTLYASGQNMVFGPGGSGRIMQAQGGYYFDFNTATGQMSWVGNNNPFWIMRANDAFCFNNVFAVGGQGPYVNLLSSGAMKTDIMEASHGLAEVLRLVPKTFRHAARPEHLHLGFVIEDVQSVIPEAVTRFEGLEPGTTMKGISDTPILAAAVNAIKAMNARIATLEARLLRE